MSASDERKRMKIILSVYSAIISIIMLLQWESFRSTLFPLLLRIITPLIAIYYGYKAIKFFGLSSVQGKSVLSMSCALTLSWIANIFWVGGTSTAVIIANIFYLLMRPVFAFGIFYSIILLDKDFFKGRKLLSFVSFMILLALVYFPIFFTWNDLSLNLTDNLVRHLFLFFDFFLLAFAFLTIYFIYLSFKGIYSRTWISLGIGTLCFWLSEIAYLTNPGNYSLYKMIELGWALGYLFFALSFAVLRINALSIVEEARTAALNRRK